MNVPTARTNTPSSDDVPLEPDFEVPTVQPYTPSVSGWIGTGLGALGGGVVGAAIGGTIALAASTNGIGGGGVMMGALALAGVALGGIGTYQMNQSSYEKREDARINADFGKPTIQAARDAIAPFDHDASGSIELENTTGLASRDERVFTEQRTRSRSEPYYDFWADEWRTRKESWTESRGTSAAELWNTADVEPKDGVITDRELARLMSRYDADRNGALTTPEQQAFKDAHPLIVEQWRRD